MSQVIKMSAEEIFAQENPNVYAARKLAGKDIGDYTKKIRKAYNGLARSIDLSLRAEGIAPGARPLKNRESELKQAPE